jgi:probable addiction module antidote protein
MTVEFAPFDVSDYLDNEEVIAEYLSAAAEDPNIEVLLRARTDVARARGMAQVARAAKLRRESLSHARPDHTISIVSAILILTVIIQVLLVKSWT